jgi:hypothetical protein
MCVSSIRRSDDYTTQLSKPDSIFAMGYPNFHN